jgi:hypothetical protein
VGSYEQDWKARFANRFSQYWYSTSKLVEDTNRNCRERKARIGKAGWDLQNEGRQNKNVREEKSAVEAFSGNVGNRHQGPGMEGLPTRLFSESKNVSGRDNRKSWRHNEGPWEFQGDPWSREIEVRRLSPEKAAGRAESDYSETTWALVTDIFRMLH